MGSGVPAPGIPEWALCGACPCSYHLSFLLPNSLLPRPIPRVSLSSISLGKFSTALRAEIVTTFPFHIAGRDILPRGSGIVRYAILKVC